MPLLFDMPLDQLKKYEGRNPKPKDFDAFWDKSLAEMRKINPKVELKPRISRLPTRSAWTCISRASAGRGFMPSC